MLEIKFHTEPLWVEKVPSNDFGHRIKMSTTFIYGKCAQTKAMKHSMKHLGLGANF